MRIAHFAPRIGSAGGIATYIRRLGEAQHTRGHEVWYLSFEPPRNGVFPPDRVEAVAGDADLFVRAAALDVDILHLHRSVAALPEDRVPTVRTMHGHQAGCPSGSRYLARSGMPCDRPYTVAGCLWGHVVDRCGSVRPHQLVGNFQRIHHQRGQVAEVPTYTVSAFLRKQMLRAGCDAAQVQTIPSPAPRVEKAFEPVNRDGVPRFLYLGRLVPQKGLDWLLRATAAASVPVHIDVGGEGPQRQELEALARELGIEAQVTFHGWVKSARVTELMRQARAVVFPSVWHEPAGLVSLEAAAYGRAVIASATGGIPEYALPSFAQLIAPRDVSGLASALEDLGSNPDQADAMGQQGMQAASTTFAMATFAAQVEAWYHEQAARNERAVGLSQK